jgi:NAD-dependent SIR2 family protein deacetylase
VQRERRLAKLYAGLSQRADHPAVQLHLLHGSLFTVRCTGFYCQYEGSNFTDPIVPALAIPTEGPQPEPAHSDKTGAEASSALFAAMNGAKELDISDGNTPIPQIRAEDLPRCPKCHTAMLRPGVVWFGEMLPKDTLEFISAFIAEPEDIDLIMVIGTSARVYPAAGYVDKAREKGARVAVINMDKDDVPGGGLERGDWLFVGDAGVIVPELLKPVIGEV